MVAEQKEKKNTVLMNSADILNRGREIPWLWLLGCYLAARETEARAASRAGSKASCDSVGERGIHPGCRRCRT